MRVKITYTVETDDPDYEEVLRSIEDELVGWGLVVGHRVGGGSLRVRRDVTTETCGEVIVDQSNF